MRRERRKEGSKDALREGVKKEQGIKEDKSCDKREEG
jgi:hypothetical protein